MEGTIGKKIVEELKLFGINRISELDKAIPSDYQDYAYDIYKKTHYKIYFIGFIRDVLMINDAKRYFEVCWRGTWNAMDSAGAEVLQHYNVDIGKYAKEYKFTIEEF